MLSRLFNKSADYTVLAGKSVKIPKLTPSKFKELLERVETLPAIIQTVFADRDVDSAIATLITGLYRGMDEIADILAVLSGLERDEIAAEADAVEISEFIRATLEKNDLQRALKNFRAVLGHFRASPVPTDGI
ncbi:hypothetical protein [Paenibacillus sp. PAMC21692]|uniref:hypothetical protein n=1 Tax=Paenibacillus sp. PAMC21692 TaxID=2762320 RepID=UPI00164E59D6|nr:hypothetical protein [Paenibacillus sp. PAMC21692]QNK54566.1 hypothetical protein H7F31_18065 [Paenibacillus sp. PAMC21692]